MKTSRMRSTPTPDRSRKYNSSFSFQIVRDEVSISKMSFHSQHLLTRETDEDRQQLFVKVLTNVKDTVTLSNIQISCITTVKRNSAQLSGVDVIVVGTELGSIYWIDSQAYSLLSYAQIQGVPEKLLAFGWMLYFL
jgi:hypothetical protein